MREGILLALILAVFLFVSLVATRLDRFFKTNRKDLEQHDHPNVTRMRLALEKPLMAEYITQAFDRYAETHGDVELTISSGSSAQKLLQKLENDAADAVLLTKKSLASLPSEDRGRLADPFGPIAMEQVSVVVGADTPDLEVSILCARIAAPALWDRIVFILQNYVPVPGDPLDGDSEQEFSALR